MPNRCPRRREGDMASQPSRARGCRAKRHLQNSGSSRPPHHVHQAFAICSARRTRASAPFGSGDPFRNVGARGVVQPDIPTMKPAILVWNAPISSGMEPCALPCRLHLWNGRTLPRRPALPLHPLVDQQKVPAIAWEQRGAEREAIDFAFALIWLQPPDLADRTVDGITPS